MISLPGSFPPLALGQVGLRRSGAPVFGAASRNQLANALKSHSALDIGSPSRFTVSAWVYFSSTQGNNGIATRSSLASSQGDWGLGVFTGSNLRVGFRVNNNAAQALSPTVLTPGLWYFIEGNYDSSLGSNNLKIFVNGNLEAQANYSTVITNTANPIFLGVYFSASFALIGYVGEFEFCANKVRHTSNYVVPATLVRDGYSTVLLKGFIP